MKRVAILGGGIAGLSAAYELARQQSAGAPIQFVLFEAAERLGGIVETEHRDRFVIECGPDSWVTEKPWARDLAVELGLESELIVSEDHKRKTYLAENGRLEPMPAGLRMMVPVEWESVLGSPVIGEEARRAYLAEPGRAEELKAAALDSAEPARDESVREFIVRHFGSEVADTIAAPLLAGVFGGDIADLSARAVLPAYVALEREHGSLILGLEQRREAFRAPVFTSLRSGLSTLIQEMQMHLPADSIRTRCTAEALELDGDGWRIRLAGADNKPPERFDGVIVATPAKATASILSGPIPQIATLLPQRCSSAILVAMAFSPEHAMQIPRGFGFLVPQRGPESNNLARRALLACTFVDQKFPHRAPSGAVLLRAFFGGAAAPALLGESDAILSALAKTAVEEFLGSLPAPKFTVVRRWPDSLPLYEVGHLQRIAELDRIAAALPSLRLIGNAYRGVGLPDLIREGRNAARELTNRLTNRR